MSEPPWFRWQDDALLLSVAVQPGAKASEIAGLHGNALKLRIQAPPVDGKANRAVVAFLAELFTLPRTRVSVLRGAGSRSKTLRIEAPDVLPSALVELGLAR